MFGRKPLPEPVSDLAIFLVERITEDEADLHLRAGRPDRIDAECEAKRRIMLRCQNMPEGWAILKLLGWPYRDHPDYRDDWLP